MADGGGVRQGSDAEEAGVSQRRGEEAARPADGSGRPAVQRNPPRPGEEEPVLSVAVSAGFCRSNIHHSVFL